MDVPGDATFTTFLVVVVAFGFTSISGRSGPRGLQGARTGFGVGWAFGTTSFILAKFRKDQKKKKGLLCNAKTSNPWQVSNDFDVEKLWNMSINFIIVIPADILCGFIFWLVGGSINPRWFHHQLRTAIWSGKCWRAKVEFTSMYCSHPQHGKCILLQKINPFLEHVVIT